MTEPAWSQNPERPRWARGADGANAAAPDVQITDDTSLFAMAMSLLFREAVSRGLGFVRSATWATEATGLEGLEGLAFHSRLSGEETALLADDGGAARVAVSDGRAFVVGAGHTAGDVDRFIATARAHLPVAVSDPEAPRVPVTFWSLGPQGPVGRTRQIDVPPWEEITTNYASSTFLELAGMMDDFTPGAGGQLLLWHGVPGTGKTYALRALAWEWREWCDLHYVTDPETFFGERAGYMLDVLLHDEGAPVGQHDPDGPAPPPPHALARDGRWRLLVLEDTGELMSSDARERAGQGLSRLLNVVDGLIGQGLRILVLVTTNEELRRLHSAVSRPGRCASKILFEPLGVEDAGFWLRKRGYEGAVDFGGGKPVADLFALLEERETAGDRQPAGVGFAP